MRFKNLHITNFRAIQNLSLTELDDIVLIVGQNGVGKSCVFDAIRLLKSSYGGYNPNEWEHWFDEFQLRGGNREITFEKVLRDKTKPLTISAELELSDSEISFLKKNGKRLIESILWKTYSNKNNIGVIDINSKSFAQQYRQYGETVDKETKAALVHLKKQIKENTFHGKAEFYIDNEPVISSNIILEIIFSTFEPDNIGIIDYHGAHRNYQKESISNLNIRFDQDLEQYKGHALYNYTNKYNNVKTEMASSYVKALIARESGYEETAISSLNDSLKELFNKFFPGKTFQGIIPTKDGRLEFPVKLSTGQIHDISELSSGEKEVLFGYLRLRNQAPRNSVILIDEPELHLNPKISKQLPEFYYKTIGLDLNNQIWLVTHSDTILQESVGLNGFSIYHMSESDSSGENQARRISIKKDIEAALIDIIGSISSYKKGNKTVIFEGKDSDFDKKMTTSLFPEFDKTVNSISAGNKSNVKNVQEVLKIAEKEGVINGQFISIVDKDSGNRIEEIDKKEFSWDVYHIENYLLNGKFILEVLKDLDIVQNEVDTELKIENELKTLAISTQKFHLRHKLHEFVENEIYKCINIRVDEEGELYKEFYEASKMTQKDINEKLSNELSEKNLKKKLLYIKNKMATSLKTDEWKKEYRGRNILKIFVSKYGQGINYEHFRNLIVSRMKIAVFRPEGMKDVIDKILELE